MTWWAFNLTLDDGRVLAWQAAGETPTEAIREIADCWLNGFGDAAKFNEAEIVTVEFIGPQTDELEAYTPGKGASSKMAAIGPDLRNEARKAGEQ